MKKIRAYMIDIETAFEMSSLETHCWLDTKTGEIVSVNEYVEDSEEIKKVNKQIDEDPERYLYIPENDSNEGYRTMQDFADTVSDKDLREKLFIALDGRGAFRRFKDVLLSYPEDRERWFAFENEKLKQRIFEWLKENGIEITG